MPRRLLVVTTALSALALLAGCGSSAPAHRSGQLRGSITVFAAASLTGTFTQLGRQFEVAHPGTTVKLSFGASSTLAQQIDQGAPADVFASAAAVNMQQVIRAGGIASSSDFASNTAELAVAPGKAATITSVDDLGKSGVTFALCQPQVPCGALATKVLGNAHVTAKPVTQGLDVKTTLAYVTNGQVDAALVYVTDVSAAGSSVIGVRIPAAENAKTEYPIGVVTASKNIPLATAFEQYVESPQGRSVLSAAGFSPP
ncbi:MAG: molybdate ABC transporter substrate-binding protein [Mycobacteriales bacterium]